MRGGKPKNSFVFLEETRSPAELVAASSVAEKTLHFRNNLEKRGPRRNKIIQNRKISSVGAAPQFSTAAVASPNRRAALLKLLDRTALLDLPRDETKRQVAPPQISIHTGKQIRHPNVAQEEAPKTVGDALDELEKIMLGTGAAGEKDESDDDVVSEAEMDPFEAELNQRMGRPSKKAAPAHKDEEDPEMAALFAESEEEDDKPAPRPKAPRPPRDEAAGEGDGSKPAAGKGKKGGKNKPLRKKRAQGAEDD
ncbi:hypothetical protein PAPYR_3925 [Paratrimastix pyriformis]|uniref:Uncharacterized protein n=1 Tax=Paratrimastix pyriformis TaxID=342808 RepID=A0ABQ8UNJ8_9EUKA|nr:hypothetical protein PAPYR_3925 [Paratrimastix pyriformis]|eukprot:GAFH01004297.1.p1 GENE.GAFH01004297.1~~GAFH01004297.1.p1  ORF type:complete len:259 (-),score=41.88 GAFH01004297.1:32-787(-)